MKRGVKRRRERLKEEGGRYTEEDKERKKDLNTERGGKRETKR